MSMSDLQVRILTGGAGRKAAKELIRACKLFGRYRVWISKADRKAKRRATRAAKKAKARGGYCPIGSR